MDSENNEALELRIENMEKELREFAHQHVMREEKRKSSRKRKFILCVIAVALLIPLMLYADQVFFSEGSLISASEMNSNFSELYAALGQSASIGNWANLNPSLNTAYSAETDGLLIINLILAINGTVWIKTGPDSAWVTSWGDTTNNVPANHARIFDNNPTNPAILSVSIRTHYILPVKEGDYWAIVSNVPSNIQGVVAQWLPLGD